jgi:hypothetical protein
MAGTIIVSSIKTDTDNSFIVRSNTGATLFSVDTTSISIPDGSITSAMIANGTVIAADILDGTITDAKIAAVANTKITGLITSGQIATVANTQITGNIASSQITSNPTLYGNVSVTGVIAVGGATPTTNGFGITFPATQSASSDANTLDDYEEGTWTPNMTFGGAAAFSSVTASGKYTKIGNCVTFEIQFGSYTKTANTGNAQITNMPFAFSDLQKVYIAQGDNLTYTSGAYLFCYNSGSGTDLNPYQQAAGTATQFTNTAFGNGGTFRVCGLYFTT